MTETTEKTGRIKKVASKIVNVKGSILEWRETIKLFKEWKTKEQEKQEDGYIEEQQKMLTPEEMEELESAAYAMSRKYKYHKLMKAAVSDLLEGREVHGWMQRIFGYIKYNWLLDNEVFDLAVNYALKYYDPEVFNLIKDYDFDNAIINVIHLDGITNFDIFPEFGFDKFIVLTQVESFENAVHWIENHPWTDFDGYTTTKTLAPCNFLNMGFTLWNLPVAVLKDTVGKDKLFFKAKTTSKQITEVRDNILKSHIYTKRQEEETANEKYQELEIKHNQLEERHQYFIDNIRAGDIRNAEEKLRDFEKKFDKKVAPNSKYKKVVIGIIAFLIIVVLVSNIITVFIQNSNPADPVDPNDIIIGSKMLSTLFRGF